MNTNDRAIEDMKTKLIESLADNLSEVGETTQESILDLGVSIYKNPKIRNDLPLQQSAALINFLNKQIKNGNDDVITKDVVQEIFCYILQKLTTGIMYNKIIYR